MYIVSFAYKHICPSSKCRGGRYSLEAKAPIRFCPGKAKGKLRSIYRSPQREITMMHSDVQAARVSSGSSVWLLIPLLLHTSAGSVLGLNLTLRTALKNVNGDGQSCRREPSPLECLPATTTSCKGVIRTRFSPQSSSIAIPRRKLSPLACRPATTTS